MSYLFIIFHIIIFGECYHLYQKKQRKKSTILFGINLGLFIINFFKFYSLIFHQVTYSSIIHFVNEFINNPLLNIFWLLLNIAYYAFIWKILNDMTRRKKQNLILQLVIKINICLLLFFFMLILFHKVAVYIILLLIIGAIILLIKMFIKEKHNYLLAIIFILLVGAFYSYGTYLGAARFQIALLGYPAMAYETGLEELKYYQEKNIKKYIPIQDIPIESGDMGIIEVKNYMGIKIGTYYGY